MTYSKQKQRQYDNQSPDESGDERDEWIAERAEEIVDHRIDDANTVAAALDDMAGSSDVSANGNTYFSETIARILMADANRLFLPVAELGNAVREYLMRDAETDAAAEFDANYLPPKFKGED